MLREPSGGEDTYEPGLVVRIRHRNDDDGDARDLLDCDACLIATGTFQVAVATTPDRRSVLFLSHRLLLPTVMGRNAHGVARVL